MIGLVISTFVIAYLNRPKPPAKASKVGAPMGDGGDPLNDMPNNSLDFGDELAQMDGGKR